MKKILILLFLAVVGCTRSMSDVPTPTATPDLLLAAYETMAAQQNELLGRVSDLAGEMDDLMKEIDKSANPAPASHSTSAEVIEIIVNEPAAAPTATAAPVEGQPDVRVNVGPIKNPNGWTGEAYEGITDQIQSWMNGLKAPDKNWPEPPNADSPAHAFVKENGMYWPNGESHYGQWGSKADLNIPALHIRVYTGDFALPGIGECRKGSDADPGCALVLVNVGNVTAMFRDGMYDYGWTTTGPYFNGDEMISSLWSVTSHVSYNMLNVAGGTNLGANCSVAEGCPGVKFTLGITSGNQVLAIATTIVK